MKSPHPRASNSRATRRSTALSIGLAVALLLPSSTPAHEQEKTPEIDKVFSWVTPGMPGCAVAVSHKGKQVVSRAYGLADLERDIPITPNTVFDAASVVKQFVAAATLLLIEDGKLSLTEDIRTYIPELPDYGHKITLDHLMTHTSGIRDWTGLGPLTGRQADALSLTLRQRGLNFSPGEEWSYSNSGYVLLKEIVARTSGTSVDNFMRTRLFEPLGMKSTRYLTDLRQVVKHRALAYEKAGSGWTLDMQLDNDRGGGGALLSTPSDLLIWNEALTTARPGKFVTEKLQEPARLNNGRKLGYARGLILDTNRESRVIWHSGGSAGYRTFLARFPEQGLSVATMCNAGETATGGAYARRIYDLFVPVTTTAGVDAKAPAASVAVEGLDVKSKAGLFFSEATGQPLRLGVDNGRLRIAGGPVLVTLTKDRFRNPEGATNFMSDDEFELHFVSADLIEMKSMEGRTTRYRRAQSYAPGADDLKAFAGRYSNDESKAVFEIAPAKSGLTFRVSWNDTQPFDFAPVDTDTFQFRGMIVRFRRDQDGQVTAFDYSNPVVRNIQFTRLSDQAARR
ncbi:MAG: serine hydrolase [Acidobacteria bacterium]|nr:serine hydrolase [Acidobacteriota bacterium]